MVSASVVGMPCAFIGFQGAVFQKPRRERSRVGIRYDLVIVAMHHQHRHVDFFRSLVKSVCENATMPS